MATQNHLKILKDGWRTWQDWRREHPDIIPNLKRATLSGVDLVDFDLTRVNFRGADLSYATIAVTSLAYANLASADPGRADAGMSNLQGAVLYEAKLGETQFVDSDLRGADLRGAYCASTNFRGADLRGVNFSEALFNYTILGDVDLSGAKNLESVIHHTYSVLDHRTIIKSGSLPIKFLRGCGLPETLIEHFPSMLTGPFYSCFISYSSEDHEFAERLYADLQERGVRCWFAPEDLRIGDSIRPRIDESIRLHDKLLLVLSETSINSQWVEQEVETALAKERELNGPVLFPIRTDDAVMSIKTGWPALVKNSRHIGDFEKWKDDDAYQKSFDRLLRGLMTIE